MQEKWGNTSHEGTSTTLASSVSPLSGPGQSQPTVPVADLSVFRLWLTEGYTAESFFNRHDVKAPLLHSILESLAGLQIVSPWMSITAEQSRWPFGLLLNSQTERADPGIRSQEWNSRATLFAVSLRIRRKY